MSKKRVLLIDDEQTFTRAIKFYLEKTDRYDVLTAHDGSTGLWAARSTRPDLILLDIVMPDMDGGHVAAEIHSDATLKHIPIVFITAIVSKQEAASQASLVGGHRFLTKPVSAKQVLSCLDEVLMGASPAADG